MALDLMTQIKVCFSSQQCVQLSKVEKLYSVNNSLVLLHQF